MKLSPEQLHIIQHSLGCDKFGQTSDGIRDEDDGCFRYYRNRYVSDPDPDLTALVTAGLLIDLGAQPIMGGMHCYQVSTEGIAAMKEQSQKAPKLSASKKRYRRYLAVAECFNSFRDFLRFESIEKKNQSL